MTSVASVDAAHRRHVNRAIVVSALGLAATGGIELTLALLTNSVGLLSDALHNLADVSSSLVPFLGRILRPGPAPSAPGP